MEDVIINSKIIIFGLIICLLASVASVSASELDQNQTICASDSDSISDSDLLNSDENEGDTAGDTINVLGDNKIDNDLESDFNESDDVLKSSNEDILSASSGTFANLKKEVDKGYRSGGVVLSNDYYSYSNSISGSTGIQLYSNIVIDGKGATIDGQSASRVFYANAKSNIVIKNINFVNTKYTGQFGGCLYFVRCSNIVIENCNLTGSTGSTGFFFQGSCSNVNITNCNFNKCTSTSSGGAVNFYAGRQSEVHNNVRIVNCTFTDNYAYYMGGAFEFYAKNSYVEDCTFIGNTARGNKGTMGEGGAFNLYAYADNVKVTNCYFENNTATKAGGAIASVSANCRYTDIVNCTFVGNSAPEGGAIKYYSDYTNMTDCSFINNTATVDGGAICSQAKHSWVKYCIFEGNSAKDGIDFYEHPGCDINFLNLIVRSLFVGNDDLTALISKGHGLNSHDPVSWQQAFYYLNLRKVYSGVTIYLVGDITNFAEKTISSPFDGILIETHILNVATVDLSGWNHRMFTIDADNVTIANLTFKNSNIQSSTDGDGGVLKIDGSGNTILNCIFTNNQAKNGGAIYFVEGNSNNTVSDSEFNNNGASVIGGAIYNAADEGTISNSIFEDNTAANHPTVYSSKDISITNSQMDNQLELTLTDTPYGQDVIINGTFSSTKNAPSTVSVYVDNVNKGTVSVSSNSFKATINKGLIVGAHTVYLTDDFGNTYTFDLNVFNVTRLSEVYISPSGTGYGTSPSDTTNWDNVESIATNDATVYFTEGTYTLSSKIVPKSWTLTNYNNADVSIGAKNGANIFTVTGNGATISGLKFSGALISNIIWQASSGSIFGCTFTGVGSANTRNINIQNGLLDLYNNTFTDSIATMSVSDIDYGEMATIAGTLNTGVNQAIAVSLSANPYGLFTNSLNIAADGVYTYVTPALTTLGNYTVTLGNNDSKSNKYIFTLTGDNVFEVKKLNTDLVLTFDKVSYLVRDDVTFNITSLATDVTGTLDILINGTTYTVDNFVHTATKTISNLPAGTHSYTITYSGDDKYTKVVKTGSLTIIKHETLLNLDIANVKVGYDVEIEVTVSSPTLANVNGTVIITGGAGSTTITITNGKGSGKLSNVGVGSYAVSGLFTETDDYSKSSTTASATVEKYSTQTVLSINDTIITGDATLTVNVSSADAVKGYDFDGLIVRVTGNKTSFDVVLNSEGIGTYTINNVQIAGVYKIIGVLQTNNYFAESSGTVQFTVNKYAVNDVALSINTTNVMDKIKVNAQVVNATGSISRAGVVEVTIEGVTKSIIIDENGLGTAVEFDALPAGSYTASALYLENNYYTKSATVSKKFSVVRYTPSIIISAENTYVGNPIIITARVTGVNSISVNGTVKLTGDFGTNDIDITNGIGILNITDFYKAGTYKFSGTFQENDYYTAKTSEANSTVISKYVTATSIDVSDVYVGDTITIAATVTSSVIENFTGNVVVAINGHTLAIPIGADGTGYVTTTEAAGNYSIAARYGGNDYYHSSDAEEKHVVVNKHAPNLVIEIDNANHKVNDTIMIIAKVTGDDNYTNGIVHIDSLLGNDTITITNGKGNITYSGVAAGTYEIDALFDSNDYYDSARADLDFTVTKYVPDLTIDVNNTYAGENILVTVQVGCSGCPISLENSVVQVKIGTEVKNITLAADGTGSVTFAPIAYGNNKVASAIVLENSYFAKSNLAEVSFNVNRYEINSINLSSNIAYVGNTTTVTATLTGNDSFAINGIVKIAGEFGEREIVISDGTGSVDITGYAAGIYTISGTFQGSEYYAPKSSGSHEVFIIKYATTTTISADAVLVGENLVFNAQVAPEIAGVAYDLTGNVTVTLNGHKVIIPIAANGTGSNSISEPAGIYSVSAIYGGNDYYASSNNYTEYAIVLKHTPTLIISIDNANPKVNDTVVVIATVTGSDNATDGVVHIDSILGNDTISIVNGKGNITYNGVAAGNYEIDALFDSNDYYDSARADFNFTVTKYATEIHVNVSDVNVGDSIAVNVEVTSAGSPFSLEDTQVQIEVGANIQTIALDSLGKGYYLLDPLSAGAGYVATAMVLENDFFAKSDKGLDSFNVNKYELTSMTLSANEAYVGNKTTMTAVLVGKNGLAVNGVLKLIGDFGERNITIVGGTGSIDIEGYAAGKYTASAIFQENEYYLTKTSSPIDVTIIKYETNTIITLTNAPVGSPVTISAQVSPAIAGISYDLTGNVTVTINGHTVIIPIGADGKGSATTVEPAGDYSVAAKYDGNYYYKTSDDSSHVSVYRNTPALEISIDNSNPKVMDDITLTIKVTGDNNATSGTVHLGSDLGQDAVSITNGVGTITYRNIASGDYTIAAIFDQNDYYNSTSANLKFTVGKYDSTLTVAVNDTYVFKNITVYVNVTTDSSLSLEGSKVQVQIGNTVKNIVLDVKGTGSVEFDSLEYGAGYIANALLLENDFFNKGNAASDTFNVIKYTPTVESFSASHAIVGEDANVTLVLVKGDYDMTGQLIVTVNGISNASIVDENGTSEKCVIGGLPAGTYSLSGTYTGNDYYESISLDSIPLYIGKQGTVIAIEVASTYVGNNLTVNATVTGTDKFKVNGNVTVTINNKQYVIPITNGSGSISDINGLASGTYKLAAVYGGSEYYAGSSTTATVNIYRHASSLQLEVNSSDIKVGDDIKVTVNLIGNNSDSEGNGIVHLATRLGNVEITLKNGTGSYVYTNVPAGSYEISAKFDQTNYYEESSGTLKFDVTKYVTSLLVSGDAISYGQDLVVSAEVTGVGKYPVNGTVIIIGNKDNRTFDVVNGKGNVSISGVEAKTYVVEALFMGNEYYEKSSANTTIFVSKLSTTLTLVINPVMVGDDVIVKAYVTGNGVYPVNGIVQVDGSKGVFNITIVNGEGQITVPQPSAGNRIVEGVFIENDIYSQSTVEVYSNIYRYASSLTLSAEPVLVGEDLVVYANVTGVDKFKVNGNVTISVNNKAYNIEIVNGTGNVSVSGLPADDYIIAGVFNQNDYYNKSSGTTHASVLKHESVIEVSVDNILRGSNLTVKVKVRGYDNDTVPTGNVTVVQDSGVSYDVQLDSTGSGTCNISDVGAEIHYFDVKYLGDSFYKSSVNATSVTVSKHESAVTLLITKDKKGEISDLKVGDPVWITVTVTAADGYSAFPSGHVIVYGKNSNYTIELGDPIKGGGQTKVTGLTAGEYYISAVYQGDDNYLKSETSKEFEIDKYASQIVINVSDVYVGDNIVVNVQANNTASGNVTITLEGEVKTVVLNQTGAGNVTFGNLTHADTYVVSAIYSGDSIYHKSSNSTSFKVMKFPTSTIISTDSGQHTIGDPLDVSVEVKYSNEIIPDGNVTIIISVNGTSVDEANVALVDGSVSHSFDTSTWTQGNYLVTVFYPGNYKFASSGNSSAVGVNQTISGDKIEISASADNKKVGENVTITVSLPQDATGNISFVVDGNATVKNLTSGQSQFTISNLTARDYSVVISYYGNNKYAPTSKTVLFTVSKWASYISAEVSDVNVGNKSNITVKVTGEDNKPVTGKASFTILGTNYTIDVVNGIGFKEIELPVGEYNVAVTYITDNRYYESSNSTSFKVNKWNSTVNVNVSDTYVLNKTTVYVNVTGGANVLPTGNVTFVVSGEKYTINLENGQGSIVLNNISAGNHVISPIYEGDSNYNVGQADATSFEVFKYNATINVTFGEIYVGQHINIIVTLNGTAGVLPCGSVSAYLNKYKNEVDKNINVYPFEFDNPTPAGDYFIFVKYYGNDVYNSNDIQYPLTVNKYTPQFNVSASDIYVLDDAYINISLGGNMSAASGNVSVLIKGKTYPVTLDKNGKYSLKIEDLPAGHYEVTLTYMGDANYTKSENFTSFNVIKYVPDVTVSVNSISVNETAHVEITLSNKTSKYPTGSVNVVINNQQYNFTINETTHKAVRDISGLKSGSYTVVATYVGDDNYDEAIGTESFDVDKFTSSLTLTSTSTNVGTNLQINISIASVNGINATGEVQIVLNNNHYNVNLTNGTLIFNNTSLPAGHYIATVTYYGDDNYDKTAGSTEFDVYKWQSKVNVTVDQDTIRVGEDAWINIEVTGDYETPGKYVVLYLNGQYYNLTLSDGKARQNVSGLASREYTAIVNYYGDDNYLVSAGNATFNVIKHDDLNVTVSADSVKIGQDAVVNITISSAGYDAEVNGKAYVYLGGVGQTIDIINGTGNATFDTSSLTEKDYIVEVTYLGDDNYDKKVGETKLSVVKWTPTINVTASETKVGGKTLITVNVTGDADVKYATGGVSVFIDNQLYSLPLTDGATSLEVTLNKAGIYVIDASYYGTGDKYYGVATNNKVSAKANYWTPNVNVTVDKIKVGQAASITVNVTSDCPSEEYVTGNVTLYINGTTQTYALVNGTFTFSVTDLAVGNYNPIVTYSGNVYNSEKEGTASFNVGKCDSTINATLESKIIKVDGTNWIYVTVEGNGVYCPTGIVNMYVGGIYYNLTLNSSGQAKQKIANLSARTHTAELRYAGDKNYYGADVVYLPFKVDKYDPAVYVSVEDTKAGQTITVNVTVNSTEFNGKANGKAYVYIRGVNQTIDIVNGKGTAEFDGSFVADDYEAIVTFLGDENYTEQSGRGLFNITKWTPTINVDVLNSSVKVGDNVTVTITVSGAAKVSKATGNVSIYINNHIYNKELTDGVYTFSERLMQSRTYTIVVDYSGASDFYYTSTSNNETAVTATFWTPTVTVTANNTKRGETAVITVKVTSDCPYEDIVSGNVSLYINGSNTRQFTLVNGEYTFSVDDLSAGSWNAIVTYWGNEYNAESAGNVLFEVTKWDSEVNVTTAEIIHVGDVAHVYIAVSGNYSNVPSGNVTVYLAGSYYPLTLDANGKAVLNVSGLSARDTVYDAEVNYGGDKYYSGNAKGHALFYVIRYDPSVSLNIEDNKVGEDTVVQVIVNSTEFAAKANGKALVVINGINQTVDIVNGVGTATFAGSLFNADNYDAVATFLGDENYTKMTGSYNFNIVKWAPLVDVSASDATLKVGDNVTVTVTVSGNASVSEASGNVSIYINGQVYNKELTNGVCNLSVRLMEARTYDINAMYNGVSDRYYYSLNNQTAVSASLWAPVVTVSVNDTKAGVPASITVVVTSDCPYENNVSGEVSLYINGNTTQKVTLNDGTYTWNRVLPATKYNAIVTYHGNEYNGESDGTDSFEVIKWNSEVNVTAQSIKVNDTVYVYIAVSGNHSAVPSGNLTAYLAGKYYPLVLDSEGKTVLKVSGLSARDTAYDVEVNYAGDDYYLGNAKGHALFYVTKYAPTVSVSAENNKVGEDTVVQIAVGSAEFGAKANGKAFVVIDGVNQTVDIVNGVGTATFEGSLLDADEHEAIVTFLGDENYTSQSGTGMFNITKWTPTVNVTVSNSTPKVGDTVNITVTVTGAAGVSQATGNVTIYVNNHEYNVALQNGVYKFDEVFMESRNYTIDASYNGISDRYYESASNRETIVSVGLWTPNVVVTVNPVYKVGDEILVIVNVTGNAGYEEFVNGEASLYLNNKTYAKQMLLRGETVFIVNGLNASGLNPWNAIVTFYGDIYYGQAVASATFEVIKWNPAITIDVPAEVYVGEDVIVNITVTGDAVKTNADGSVQILLSNGKTFELDLINGTQSFNLGSLNASDLGKVSYTIDVTYYGDEYYNKEVTEATFNVSKSNVDVSVHAQDIMVDDDTFINITVISQSKAPVTGKVRIEIPSLNITEDVELTNGNVVYATPVNQANFYEVLVTYLGSYAHNQAHGEDSFTVTKYTTSVSFIVENVTYVNDIANITAVLTDKTSGTVSIDLLGKEYSIPVTDGKGSIQIPITSDGNKGLVAVSGYFNGNYKYFISEANETMFYVSKITAEINVSVEDAALNENIIVNVTVTAGTTGNVTVTINNKTQRLVLDENSKAQFSLSEIPAGNYTVYVKYEGDYQYNSTENNTQDVSVIKADTTLDVTIPEIVKVGDDAVITVKLPVSGEPGNITATGNLTVSVGEFKDNVTIVNGTATFTVPSSYLPEGNYTVSADYAGDRNYNAASITTPAFPVRYSNSTDLQALIDEAVANNQSEVNLTYDYKFTENDTAVVVPSNITINGGGHTIDAQNKTGVLNITGDNVTVNDVVITGGNSTEGGAINWEGDDGTIANSTFVGNNATNGGAVYSDGDNLTIVNSTFTNNTADSGASVFVNGDNTNVSNSTFANNTAADGSPGIAVNGEDLSYNVDNATASNSDKPYLNIITRINAAVSDGYENQVPAVITVNTNTKYGTVVATVNGKNYTAEISNGTGTITISNLAIGSYNDVVISYLNNNNYTSAQTTVNFTVHKNKANIINSDVTKDYNSGYKYKARIIGVDGKPVGAGVVFKITLGGKTKTYKTDANGYIIIKLDKSYVPAKYTIKLSWKGVSTKHVITVKQILKVKKTIKIKKSAVKLKIKAKLKLSNGKALKNKKIKFKFRGKTYTAKTNKKGIAKVTIKKKVLKKLKAGKKYKVKITYLKDSVKSYIKVKK